MALLSYSTPSAAEVAVTLTGASDYLFNGVSQTDEKPAIQGSLDWSNKFGWYAGIWGANVDFGDDTKAEVDYYLGYSQSIDKNFWYEVGLAHYTYLGDSNSSDINYSEPYFALGYQSTQIKAWYANDYAGTDAAHYIVAVMHSIEINNNLTLNLQIDQSKSLDKKLFAWDDDDDSYLHYKTEAAFNWQDLAFTLSIEKTDLSYDDDVKLFASVSYTFAI